MARSMELIRAPRDPLNFISSALAVLGRLYFCDAETGAFAFAPSPSGVIIASSVAVRDGMI